MTTANMLLTGDNLEYSRFLGYVLEKEGVQVVISSVEAFFARQAGEPFDLVIVDVYTSWAEALRLCRQLQPRKHVPILLVIHFQEAVDFLEAYRAGADECLAPPLNPELFLARVAIWLRWARRQPGHQPDTLQVGEFCLGPDRRTLTMPGGDAIRLSRQEGRLLHLLMSHPGQTVGNAAIIHHVWRANGDCSDAVLRNAIYHLRRKIEPDPRRPRYLQRAAGGYRFTSDDGR
ncbi:MAG: response regulator transcription factor [Chloroflexi bacterium]|nr:response regulator transcription factor [Chloroflexota bacterium]MCI0576313.1 response regulator transcription factor [Chloroflexota bacterium]MCI0650018.1 response regulator transcription factor [Chloroflexota bacterium]MCI0730498.1 response regulator transcription factor [Chloroflexota bacterium]